MATNTFLAIGDRRIERRSPTPADQLPIEALQQMPALVVLERIPTPALAADHAGAILFANGSFSDMVGYSSDELLSMKFEDIFRGLPASERAGSPFGTGPNRLVELRHKRGHSVWAVMSKSALRRCDDTVALATFDDCTEEVWLNSAAPERLRENATRNQQPVARNGSRPG